MGNRYGMRALIGVLLAVAVAAAIGYFAYDAGVAHGLAESGRLATLPGGAIPGGTVPGGTVPGGTVPYVYLWPPRPWGFGFFPFFFILLWFFILRGLFWRRGGWWHGRYDDGVPPRFDEWHRRAHERDASRPTPGSSTPGVTA